MKHLPAASVVVLLAVALIGCGDGSDGDGGTPLAYEMRLLERSEGECADGESVPCGRFVAEYPEIVGAPEETVRDDLNAAVQAMLLAPAFTDRGPTDLEQLAEGFLEEYRSTRREFPDAVSTARWTIERRVLVIRSDRRVFSVLHTEFSFTGGAHPNSSSTYASFDPSSGRRLGLSDVLVPGYESRLDEVAERRFREVRAIPPGKSLSDAGFWFEDDRFAVSENFAVTDQGLIFQYNPYEVAPYSLGPTELVLSRRDLGPLILPAGPLGDIPH